MKKLLLTLALIGTVCAVRADEGMWLLPYLQKMNIKDMRAEGCRLTAEDIYSVNNSSLKDAVIVFGGGCSCFLQSHAHVFFVFAMLSIGGGFTFVFHVCYLNDIKNRWAKLHYLLQKLEYISDVGLIYALLANI